MSKAYGLDIIKAPIEVSKAYGLDIIKAPIEDYEDYEKRYAPFTPKSHRGTQKELQTEKTRMKHQPTSVAEEMRPVGNDWAWTNARRITANANVYYERLLSTFMINIYDKH